MTTRRAILRELSRNGHNGNGFTRPGNLTGFAAKPERFQAAVNQLLQERLINGTKDEDGRLAIAINEHRMDDVRRELRPVWTRPAAWLAFIVLIAAAAAFTLL